MRVVIIACSLGILALPLYVDGSVIYPFSFSKGIVFQILAEVAFGAFVVLRVVSYRHSEAEPGNPDGSGNDGIPRQARDDKGDGRDDTWINWRHPVIVANGVFIALMFVLAFTGVDAGRSLWSTAQWMSGVVMYLHLFLWLVTLSAVMKAWNEWRLLLWTSIAVCFAAIVYGFAQWGRFEGVQLSEASTRIYSLLGNPIYLALYILLNFFLSIVLFVKERSIFLRMLLVFFGVLCVVALFLSGTRSAVLTLGISAVLFALIYLFTIIRGKGRIVGFSLLVVCVIAIVGIFLWLQSPQGTQWSREYLDEGTQRIVSQLFQDPARVELSNIAWQGFLARPLFGWGLNNYSYVFSTFVRPGDFGVLFPSTWYDQAHNQVMNVLATMGVVGLLAYLALFGAVWWVLKKRHDDNEKIVLIVLGLFFFAYFLQTLTAFDTIGPMIMLYMGFGFVYYLSEGSGFRVQGIDDGNKSKYGNSRVWIPACAGMTILAGFFIFFINAVPYEKAKTGKKAIDVTLHDFDRGLKLYRRALSGFSFTHEDVRIQLARHAALYHDKFRTPSEQKKEFLWYAISENEKNVEAHPWSLEYVMALLPLYRTYAEEYSDAVLFRAEELASRMMERYPHRRDVLYEKAFVAKERGDMTSAAKTARALIDLDPARSESYWWAAQIALDDSRIGDSLGFLREALERGFPIFDDGGFYLRLAQKAGAGDMERVKSLVSEGMTRHPNTLDFRVARAILFYKIGKKRDAIEDIEWVRERDEALAKKIEEILER